MKKFLLTCALAGLALPALCDDAMYFWTWEEDETPVFGSMRRVSPNGQWATGGDYLDNTGSFIVDVTKPSELIRVPDGELYDIDNNGTAVGCMYVYEGSTHYNYAAIWSGSEWLPLEEHEDFAGQSYAMAISGDGKYIGGHAWCYDKVGEVDEDEPKGRMYPVLWKYDDDSNSYKVEAMYNEIDIPKNLGFYVYDMTSDGSVLCGFIATEAGGQVPAMMRDGELVYWNVFETRFEPFFYKDQILGYLDEYYVDGVHEGADGDYFDGVFAYATDRYLFGGRTIISNLSEDSQSANYDHYSTVYDLKEDTFYDYPSYATFMSGGDLNNIFDNGGRYFSDNVYQWTDEFFSLGGERRVDGVYGMDDSFKVFACCSLHFNDVIGEYFESPILVVLDTPGFDGIDNVKANANPAKINVEDNTINIQGASKVQVFNVGGALVSTSPQSIVPPGVYVVVVDGVPTKVTVGKL